jgi:predicted DNA-binding protein
MVQEPTVALYARIPAALKQRIADLAERRGEDITSITIRALEVGLESVEADGSTSKPKKARPR